jgi:hypothetical protein
MASLTAGIHHVAIAAWLAPIPLLLRGPLIRLLARVGPGDTDGQRPVLVVKMARPFGDLHSGPYYRGEVNDVARGDLSAGFVGSAIRDATGPKVLNRGAVFTSKIERAREAKELASVGAGRETIRSAELEWEDDFIPI